MSSEQLQPVTAPKPRRSVKPPSVKTAVIAGRANGKPKAHIAKELGISRPTVDAIIRESQIDVLMESGERTAFMLMHKSLNVLDSRLDKGSESAATYLLSNTLFSDKYAKKQAPPADVVVNLAIQNLIQPTQNSEVVDNKQDNEKQ